MSGSIMTDVVRLYNFQRSAKGKPGMSAGGVVQNPKPVKRKPVKR